jgi:hypothetical protein
VRSRLEAYQLRALVQETAIALTVNGTECISHEELEREMKLWSNRSSSERNTKLAAIDPDIFLINYLFKSGVEPLGCEFIHKSLREFAFAQAVVDRLKRCAIRVETEQRHYVDIITEAGLGILSRQWLSREIWDHIERQIAWEIYRESAEHEDPIAFQRGELPLGLDAWCHVRDRLADRWASWAHTTADLVPLEPDPENLERFKNIPIDSAGADARIGAALFRLCATLHGTLTGRILEIHKLMDHQKNMWEELGETESVGSSQTTPKHRPDPRLRFFSPTKGDDQLERSILMTTMARINGYYILTREEFPERCDLTFLVSTAAALIRLSFQYCNLSFCNFSESNLSGADMQGADLSGAWLYKANLSRANFSMCDLPYASFRKADLEGTSLKSADIECADFREATGLTLEQVRVTRNWQSAKFDPDFAAQLRELKDSDEQEPNAEYHGN